MSELLVIYDTTALRSHRHDLDHPTLAAIRQLREELGYRIAIPEVVCAEAIRQEQQYLEAQWSRGVAAFKSVAQKLGLASEDLYQTSRFQPELERYQQHFRRRLEDLHDEVLPLPRVDAADLLRRDLEDRKPFNNGKGLRDYLIWLSILEAMRRDEGEVLFVTANSRDFAPDGKLAPDYLTDLADKDVGGSVRIVTDPETFLNSYARPSRDESQAAIGKRLDEVWPTVSEESAMAALGIYLHSPDALPEVLGNYTDLPPWLATAPMTLGYDLGLGNVRRVLRISETEKLVDIEAGWTWVFEPTYGNGQDFRECQVTMVVIVRVIVDVARGAVSNLRFMSVESLTVEQFDS